MNGTSPSMHTHRTPDVALWDQYRALREQWTHEDNLVHHRMSWLLVSSGLMFTAYSNMAASGATWLRIGFPFFGMAVAALIGVGIYTAMSATEEIKRQFEIAGLADLFVFGGMWLLALLGRLSE
jgi:hypothetical protein